MTPKSQVLKAGDREMSTLCRLCESTTLGVHAPHCPLYVVRIVVPLRPPSVNHYKTAFVRRGVIRYVVSAEGLAFKAAVAVLAGGRTLAPLPAGYTPKMVLALRRTVRYRLSVVVVLGKGQRGDGDNFWKCIADGLVEAGVIHSDAAVREWHLVVEDGERGEPRTEILAEVCQ